MWHILQFDLDRGGAKTNFNFIFYLDRATLILSAVCLIMTGKRITDVLAYFGLINCAIESNRILYYVHCYSVEPP